MQFLCECFLYLVVSTVFISSSWCTLILVVYMIYPVSLDIALYIVSINGIQLARQSKKVRDRVRECVSERERERERERVLLRLKL